MSALRDATVAFVDAKNRADHAEFLMEVMRTEKRLDEALRLLGEVRSYLGAPPALLDAIEAFLDGQP